jgi:F-type H+-transporting ATPase subunit a
MNASDYVLHHLSHCQLGDGSFWTVNIDSVIISFMIGCAFLFPMWFLLKQAKIKPNFWQNFFEFFFSFVQQEVKASSPDHINTIGPLALTTFLWIFSMNIMDLLPIDTGYLIARLFGLHAEFKLVPTADINVTIALALFTFTVINANLIGRLGVINYFKGFFTHPFSIYLFPANFFFRLVEEFSKVFSLAMRLFGNMFAGEIIFILLALAPLPIQIPAVLSWSIFHILIVFLQAFIFMMLTIINFGLALEHH